MTPTIDYLQEQFSRFNATYFGNELPTPHIVIAHARTFAGKFLFRRRDRLRVQKVKDRDYTIKISDFYDLPEREVQNTLLHEMIHYYIEYRGIKDTSPHGDVFKSMMEHLNGKGWNITVRVNTDTASIAERNSVAAVRTVLALRTDNGKLFFSVVNPKFVERLERKIRLSPNIVFHKWLKSSDAYFQRFPAVRSLRGIRVDEATFRKFMENATAAK